MEGILCQYYQSWLLNSISNKFTGLYGQIKKACGGKELGLGDLLVPHVWEKLTLRISRFPELVH